MFYVRSQNVAQRCFKDILTFLKELIDGSFKIREFHNQYTLIDQTLKAFRTF